MKNNKTKVSTNWTKNAMTIAVSASIASMAFGQSETNTAEGDNPAQMEEVIVTGFKQNLETAQDMKRSSDTVLDAISASDIGDLPDVSVLESLQRLPGVSIERFAAVDDTDHFSTEGSNITLRGLPQARSEFNGRDSFSASNNRGLNFSDVPPALLGSVEVFKNHTADQVEGGIAGTINLNTRKPFDSSDRRVDLSAQLNRGDLEEETTPAINALFSDRWELPDGSELGFLTSYSRSQLAFRTDGTELGKHTLVTNPAGVTGDLYVPINAGVRTTSTDRYRTGLSAALQYASADDDWEVTLEHIRSDSSADWTEHAFFSDGDAGTLAAGATFDDTSLVSGNIVFGPGSGVGPQIRRQQSGQEITDTSLNVVWHTSEQLTLSADFQQVKAVSDVTDLTIFGSILGDGFQVGVNNASGEPSVSFRAPDSFAGSDDAYFSDPSHYYWRAAMDHLQDNEGDLEAFKLDADYAFDDGLIDSVQVGVRLANREQTTRFSAYNWGVLSESWAGGQRSFGGELIAGDGTSTTVGSPPSALFSPEDFHRGDLGLGINALYPDPSLIASTQSFNQGLSTFGRTELQNRAGVITGTPFLPVEVNEIEERNSAAYIRVNFETDWDRRLGGNMGLRYVSVDTAVVGGQIFPTLDAQTAMFASAEEQAFANGAVDNRDAESTYDTVLPSLNLKYELADDWIARFAASKAVAWPDIGDLRYNYSIFYETEMDMAGNPDIRRFRQISGNPFLEPMESNNYDLTLEWYFNSADALTLGLFRKDIKNFFATDTAPTAVSNNGVVQTVEISQPVNLDEGSITGLELGYSQFFDELPGLWRGLGMSFNYTLLHESGVPNQNTRPNGLGSDGDLDRAQKPFENLPLQGLSENSFNLVGMYEIDNVSARLAYNWREAHLVSIRHVNLGLPVYTDDRGQLDGSFFYRVTEEIELGVQATNILNENTVTTIQMDQQGTQVSRSSFAMDRRIVFSVNISL